MSRRSNKQRRKKRRERKDALQEAKIEFHKKYPERGRYLPMFMINLYAQMYGYEYANERYKENRDPLNFDHILMKKKRKLYDYYFSHNRWKQGLESLNKPGWAPNPRLEYEPVQIPSAQILVDTLSTDS